jgi:hypothetical protein
VPLFRRRFADLVSRQLDLFARENQHRLAALAAAFSAHRSGPDEDLSETYGDYQDEVDRAAAELLSLRDTYARSLDSADVPEYERAFARGVRRRFPVLVTAIETEDVG